MTNAERQRAIRQRRQRARVGSHVPEDGRSEGEQQLNVWLRTSAVIALRRLSAAHELSQRLMLEKLILEADVTE
jgi:hypothetical protein